MLKLGEKFGETLYLLAFEIANNWVQKNDLSVRTTKLLLRYIRAVTADCHLPNTKRESKRPCN